MEFTGSTGASWNAIYANELLVVNKSKYGKFANVKINLMILCVCGI